MRSMRIAKALVVAVTLLGVGAARADEVVRVERHRNTPGIILRDAVSGAALGSAVSGGVILYNMGIQGHDDYNWGRTLALGAGIGLAAGLVWGVIDAAQTPDTYAMRAPVHDGQSLTMNRGSDQSHTNLMTVAAGRF